jgi:hypothetical protein
MNFDASLWNEKRKILFWVGNKKIKILKHGGGE